MQCTDIIYWWSFPSWFPPFAWCSRMIAWYSWGTMALIRLQRHSSWKVTLRVGHNGLPWHRRVQWRTWRVGCFDGVSTNWRLGLRTHRLGTEIEWRTPNITPSSSCFVDGTATTRSEKGRKVIKVRLWLMCLECLVSTTFNLHTYNIRSKRLQPP